MRSIRQLINRIEAQPLSLSKWLLVFASVVFVRNLLEAVSSPRPDGRLTDPLTFLFHYPLFYLCVVLSIILVLKAITRRDAISLAKLAVFGLVVLWLAPVVDLLLTLGRGWTTAYLFAGGPGLLTDLVTFFGPFLTQGITAGIRFGVLLGLFGVFFYVWHRTRRLGRAVFAAIAVYVIIFLFFAAPSILVLVSGLTSFTATPQEVVNAFRDILTRDSILTRHWLGDDAYTVTATRFSVLMAEAYLLLAVPLLLGVFASIDRRKVLEFMRNGRWLRVIHFLVIAGLGAEIAVLTGSPLHPDLPNLIGLAVLACGLIASWFSAVSVNDLADERGDRLNSPHRPIPAGTLRREGMKVIAVLTSFLGLVAGLLIGWSAFLALLAFQLFYFVYSSPPLRLKAVFLLNNILVGLAQLSVVIAGFLTVRGEVSVADFPAKLLLMFLGVFLLAAPIKDLKDLAGDRIEGIPTLPVRFGEKRGKIALSVLVILASFIPAFVLKSPILFVPAFIAAFLVPFFIYRKPYREAPILVMGIVYFVLIGFVVSSTFG